MRRPRPSLHPASAGVRRDLEIDRLGGQGDGVAEGGVMIPFTLPGERVDVRVVGARGELEAVLQASPSRVAPPCPHFAACGGCALQHFAAAPYLDWKVGQIAEALGREGIETHFDLPYAAAPGERHRLALHARRGVGGGVTLGFKMRRAWTVVDIAVCPVADPELVAALPALRRLAAPFLEHPRSAPTLHVTATATGIDVEVTGVERRSAGLSADARARAAEIAANAGFARVTLGGEVVFLAREPVVVFGGVRVGLPAGGFLQASAGAERAMADYAAAAVDGAARVADLYSGAGAFTFRLAATAGVVAADASAGAVQALQAAAGAAVGLKAVVAEVRDLVRRPMLAAELKRVEAVVFDPPRAGAAEQAAEIAKSRVPICIGVSCDPQTFARDAALLRAGGFRLTRVLPVDQFLWSPHIELVGVFTR